MSDDPLRQLRHTLKAMQRDRHIKRHTQVLDDSTGVQFLPEHKEEYSATVQRVERKIINFKHIISYLDEFCTVQPVCDP